MEHKIFTDEDGVRWKLEETIPTKLDFKEELPDFLKNKPKYIYWTDEDGFTWRIRK